MCKYAVDELEANTEGLSGISLFMVLVVKGDI